MPAGYKQTMTPFLRNWEPTPQRILFGKLKDFGGYDLEQNRTNEPRLKQGLATAERSSSGYED